MLTQEYGLACFPLSAGEKTPLPRSRGCLDASTHAERVCEWAERLPHTNFGVACGGWARLFVIDFDRPGARDELTTRYGLRPTTLTVRTPKGLHEYYAAPDGITLRNSAGLLLSGVDTRGHHGYVVGAGSMLADGRSYSYVAGRSVANVAIAPLPERILSALLAPSITTLKPSAFTNRKSRVHGDMMARVAGYLRTMPPLRDGEGRNATAFRIAAFVLHACAGATGDARTALQVWNERNCEPLAEQRVEAILANAARYGAASAA